MITTADGKMLEGIRILDFSRVLAGPFCTALLADLGAEVVKVEPPGGDDYRFVGPFLESESALFLTVNRGKRSIVIDLKRDRGVELARRLAAQSDVVVENFRPGVAQKLGIGYEDLEPLNSKLVYASISGFGQFGEFSRLPAYDIIVQAMSGLMHITGDSNGPPTLVGEAIGDLAAGLFGSWAILAALFARERSGKGRYIDVALFDSLVSLLPTSLCQLLYADRVPMRVGNRHQLSAPFGAFPALDGDVVIAVLNDKLFEKLARTIERPDLLEDPRFTNDESRCMNESALRQAIEAWTRARAAAEVVRLLSEAGVPAAPIWDIRQATDNAHIKARGLFASAEHATLGTIPIPEQPVSFGGHRRGATTAPPVLGEHTDAVLREVLNASDDEISALRKTEVIL
jgi:CoA:oxalate CoA-transferase